MPVSIKHHVLVVGFLLGVIIGLAAALTMMSLHIGPFRVEASAVNMFIHPTVGQSDI